MLLSTYFDALIDDGYTITTLNSIDDIDGKSIIIDIHDTLTNHTVRQIITDYALIQTYDNYDRILMRYIDGIIKELEAVRKVTIKDK